MKAIILLIAMSAGCSQEQDETTNPKIEMSASRKIAHSPDEPPPGVTLLCSDDGYYSVTFGGRHFAIDSVSTNKWEILSRAWKMFPTGYTNGAVSWQESFNDFQWHECEGESIPQPNYVKTTNGLELLIMGARFTNYLMLPVTSIITTLQTNITETPTDFTGSESIPCPDGMIGCLVNHSKLVNPQGKIVTSNVVETTTLKFDWKGQEQTNEIKRTIAESSVHLLKTNGWVEIKYAQTISSGTATNITANPLIIINGNSSTP